MSNGDETTYRAEVENLSNRCSENNLTLNILKTKEPIMDWRRHREVHSPLKWRMGVICLHLQVTGHPDLCLSHLDPQHQHPDKEGPAYFSCNCKYKTSVYKSLHVKNTSSNYFYTFSLFILQALTSHQKYLPS